MLSSLLALAKEQLSKVGQRDFLIEMGNSSRNFNRRLILLSGKYIYMVFLSTMDFKWTGQKLRQIFI
ncbi:hypothetical protein BER93_07925 [Xanthomonas fragariae]|nr:hypothetical protein BER92_07895 [Xanthomonas fragariae]AOD18061.1 hypothetical protein BER93_07925 [Xanthomonas fragariae]ENZ95891.1 hypothetical protein O1K_07690 [Xanthomonas fragariae LMG 25863]